MAKIVYRLIGSSQKKCSSVCVILRLCIIHTYGRPCQKSCHLKKTGSYCFVRNARRDSRRICSARQKSLASAHIPRTIIVGFTGTTRRCSGLPRTGKGQLYQRAPKRFSRVMLYRSVWAASCASLLVSLAVPSASSNNKNLTALRTTRRESKTSKVSRLPGWRESSRITSWLAYEEELDPAATARAEGLVGIPSKDRANGGTPEKVVHRSRNCGVLEKSTSLKSPRSDIHHHLIVEPNGVWRQR